MTEHASPEPKDAERARTRFEVVMRYRWWLLVVLGLVAGAAYVVTQDVAVPRWLKIAGLAAAASMPLGAPAAARIVNWLYSPGYVYLVDLDPSGDDEFAVWELPPARWRELDVAGGELHRLPSKATAYEVLAYDLEANEATGTWRGSASDSQLLDWEYKVDEVRGELEDAAREGRVLKVTRARRIRSALDRILTQFVQDFEAESLYSGEAVQKATERALRDAGLEPGGKPATDPVGDDGSEAARNAQTIEFVFPNEGDGQEAADAD